MKVAHTMTAVQQWQWWLSLRRGAERFPPVVHGKFGTYTNGCRCAPCTRANADHGREFLARRRRGGW